MRCCNNIRNSAFRCDAKHFNGFRHIDSSVVNVGQDMAMNIYHFSP